MTIRVFRNGDEAAVSAMWRRVFTDEPARNEPRLLIAGKRAVQPELFWVATLDGAVVAALMAGYDGHRGWLYHLAVAPEHRRRGVGRALVAEAETKLRALGCRKINLQVRGSNAATTRFYERLGYTIEDRVSLGKPLA